jgi:folylpolyglutamate synthase/dihydropteroate synthase
LQKLNSGVLVDTIPNTAELWVDGAHNIAGSFVLSSWLKENPSLPTYLKPLLTPGITSTAS